MSYKVDFAAADVQWQILALKEMPKIANKHFYPAMQRAARELKGEILPHVPVATGRAVSAFNSKVSGSGLNIQARVGWWGQNQPWYINVLEYGAKEHEQGYIPRLGVQIKIHPGIPALKFMEQGYQRARDGIDTEMLIAADRVVQELAVK